MSSLEQPALKVCVCLCVCLHASQLLVKEIRSDVWPVRDFYSTFLIQLQNLTSVAQSVNGIITSLGGTHSSFFTKVIDIDKNEIVFYFISLVLQLPLFEGYCSIHQSNMLWGQIIFNILVLCLRLTVQTWQASGLFCAIIARLSRVGSLHTLWFLATVQRHAD